MSCDYRFEPETENFFMHKSKCEARFAGMAPKNNQIEGKPDMSLLPMDLLEKYLVPVYEVGVKKYFRESWRAGFKSSVMIAAILRHLTRWYWHNEELDAQDHQHHLGAIIFCCLSLLNTLETKSHLDDRRAVK